MTKLSQIPKQLNHTYLCTLILGITQTSLLCGADGTTLAKEWMAEYGSYQRELPISWVNGTIQEGAQVWSEVPECPSSSLIS